VKNDFYPVGASSDVIERKNHKFKNSAATDFYDYK